MTETYVVCKAYSLPGPLQEKFAIDPRSILFLVPKTNISSRHIPKICAFLSEFSVESKSSRMFHELERLPEADKVSSYFP